MFRCTGQWLADYVSAYLVKYKLDGSMDAIIEELIKKVYCPVCGKKMRYGECGSEEGGGGEEEEEGGGGDDEAVPLGLEEMAGTWIISSIIMFCGGLMAVVQAFMYREKASDTPLAPEDVELDVNGEAVRVKADVVSPGRRLMGGTDQVRQELDSLTEHFDWLLERMSELEKASARTMSSRSRVRCRGASMCLSSWCVCMTCSRALLIHTFARGI